MSAPLYVEPLLGWRLWHVRRRAGQWRLCSWSRRTEWPAGERLEACCEPVRRRGCGVYALRSRELAERLLSPFPLRHPVAVGRASLWGRVVENTEGWRAQYAYPYELFLIGGSAETARALRDRYGIDVS